MSDRFLFLDFDGVINGLYAPSVEAVWGEREVDILQGFQISYSPALVNSIEVMSACGVQVVWLTTWCSHTVEFPRLGFSAYPYIGEEEHASGGVRPWWKWDALRTYVDGLPPGALIGWCDDDLDDYARYDPSITAFTAQPNVLAIVPDRYTGLLGAHVEMLREHFDLAVTR